MVWTARSAPAMSGTCCVKAVRPFAWHEYSEVESAQLGDPLARLLHVYGDLGQGPWVWKRGQAMQ